MRQFFKLYALIFACLIFFDGFWLWSMMGVYKEELGPILLASYRPAPAILFYFVYALAVLVLVVSASSDAFDAFLRGGLLGLAAYGTYDLTNYATIEHFSRFITCADLAWGTTLTAVSSALVTAWRNGRNRGATRTPRSDPFGVLGTH